MNDERMPLKLIAAKLGISRSTLWRMTRSSLEGIPTSVKHRGRVYWRRSDLPALEAAHAKFAGRSVFERDRKHEKARAQRQALTPKAKPRRIKAKQNDVRQIDLFSDDARTTGEDGQSRS